MKKRTKRKLIKLLLFIIFIVICIFGYFIIGGYNLYQQVTSQMSINEKINSIKNIDNYTTIKDIPDYYKNAVIAVEDHRFYSHSGIDFITTIKAAFKNIISLSLVEGGSTITQQVAKNMYFSQRKEFTRKIAELFVAKKLEKNYSKDEIFELYINNIYYGDGYYNIYDASKGYFKKKPSNLTFEEATLLAGIPNAPSVYSLSVNPDLAHQRQNQVISAMKKYNYEVKI